MHLHKHLGVKRIEKFNWTCATVGGNRQHDYP